MLPARLEREIATRLGTRVKAAVELNSGVGGRLYRVELQDGRAFAVKTGGASKSALETEGFMLCYLTERTSLPVPKVEAEGPDWLAMELLPGGSHYSPKAERHAAELLARLHAIRGENFGFERDTLIGALPQPNPAETSWVTFFREHRLRRFAADARREGRISAALVRRIESLAQKLDELIDEPAHPSLLHGDVWSGNVLADGDRITGFIDPAIYFGHPEIELAFITLFDTFGSDFFSHYDELLPIRPGFFETRRHVYNLYPLLVHVRLFGGSYVSGVEQTLERFGF